ncbi:unnamed protein product [Lupinus luteus]|uniref:Uncharacterized protein n=1 Tax=Lupinus luteus TaxID=3873 RepID=A0AAV1XCN1_LUPLU
MKLLKASSVDRVNITGEQLARPEQQLVDTPCMHARVWSRALASGTRRRSKAVVAERHARVAANVGRQAAASAVVGVFDSLSLLWFILALPAMLLEGNGILEWFNAHPYPWSALVIIFSPGVLAFCLNFSIFYVIHSTAAVTFKVAGNLKGVVDGVPYTTGLVDGIPVFTLENAPPIHDNGRKHGPYSRFPLS